MTIIEIFNLFNQSLSQQKIVENIHSESNFYHSIKGSKASHPALIISGAYYYLRQTKSEKNLVFVCDSHEQAAYFFNDIQNFAEKLIEENSSSIFFFPASYKKPYALTDIDNANVLSRAELLNRLNKENLTTLVITYPQALQEKVITKTQLIKNTLQLTLQEKISIEFITDLLFEYNFERVDYVYEPGQYSVRGGIVDIFSFSNDLPFRIEFFGEEVESIRSFDITTQLSVRNYNNINIIPNLQDSTIVESYESLPQFLSENTVYFFTNFGFALEQLENFFELCTKEFESINSGVKHLPPQDLYMSNVELAGQMQARKVFDFAPKNVIPVEQEILFNTEPQPSFNKNFELLIADLKSKNRKYFKRCFKVE
jgi:transcription-repair coupling factor (superfamily II helicase)